MAFGFGVPERVWKFDKSTINSTYLVYSHEESEGDKVLEIKNRQMDAEVGLDYRNELAMLFDGR